jgi:DNA-directed RNA polymerase II subunit RPB2
MICYSGYNQEDSLIANKAAIERGEYKIMNGTFIQSKADKGEYFGNPNRDYTVDLKMYANYSHLKDGLPQKGDIINRNDAIIGKYAEIPDSDKLRDISVTYPSTEPAYVASTPVKSHNQNGDLFVTVTLNSIRPITPGQKFSTRHGNKGEVSVCMNHADLPFNQDGLVPYLSCNPHCMPSRMAVSQLREGHYGKVLAINGQLGDATIFRRIDIEEIGDKLEELGYTRYGTEKMFNGMTGEWIDYEIFFTPTYYQRLQKFVEEDVYAISTGPTCAITRQPLEGKANKGGLRIGEMEKDVLISHGSSRFLMEKFRDDSDGFEVYVCRTCGKTPIVNEAKEIYKCNNCQKQGTNPDIVKVPSTWTSKLFLQELETMNVCINLEVAPFAYEMFQ